MNIDFVTDEEIEGLAQFAEPEMLRKLEPHRGKLINIHKAIELGGFTKRGGFSHIKIPVLAIAPLASTCVQLDLREGSLLYKNDASGVPNVRVDIPWARYWGEEPISQLPKIPRRALEAGVGATHVLWEANWERTVPKGDPALLKHLFGALYAVLTTWDLTEAEKRAIDLL